MVISNLNIKLIEDRLGLIITALVKLQKLSNLSKEDFLKNDRPAIAESYLRRSLEAIFDIGRHIVAKRAGKGIIEYKKIVPELFNLNIISEELSKKLRLMAGYRNRLVHFYQDVSDEELYIILKSRLGDVSDFIEEIRLFLSKYSGYNNSY